MKGYPTHDDMSRKRGQEGKACGALLMSLSEVGIPERTGWAACGNCGPIEVSQRMYGRVSAAREAAGIAPLPVPERQLLMADLPRTVRKALYRAAHDEMQPSRWPKQRAVALGILTDSGHLTKKGLDLAASVGWEIAPAVSGRLGVAT